MHKGCGYRRASDAAEWNLSAAWTAGYGDPLACARGRAHRARSTLMNMVPEEGFGRAQRLRVSPCQRCGGVESFGSMDCRLRRSAGLCSGTRASRAFNPHEYGAGGGIRTLTELPQADFESAASAIPPLRHGAYSHPHRATGQASQACPETQDRKTPTIAPRSKALKPRDSQRLLPSQTNNSAVSPSLAIAAPSTGGKGKSSSSLVGMRWM